MNKLNNNYKIGQLVVCTLGENKGEKFVIEAILKNSYSCSLFDNRDNKYYEYNDSTLKICE